jgi:shikimate dehydrogenase
LSIHCLPTLHNYWIKSNGIDAIYEKQKLEDSELGLLIEQLKKRKIDGVNVTVPYKKGYHTFFR